MARSSDEKMKAGSGAADDAKAATENMGEAAAGAGAEVRKRVGSAAAAVQQDAMKRAESAREGVAEDVDAIARALQRGGEELRPDSPQARAWGGLADRVGIAAEALRSQDLPTMAKTVGAFARENPTTFLVGAALMGFVASRFALATDQREAEPRRGDWA